MGLIIKNILGKSSNQNIYCSKFIRGFSSYSKVQFDEKSSNHQNIESNLKSNLNSKKNYFSLFPLSFPQKSENIKNFFVLPPNNQLYREYIQLQSKTHPDKSSNEDERLKFEKQSSLLNHAYSILKDPLSRAEYLLELNNMGIGEETMDEKAPVDFTLLEIMEFHEEIENATSNEQLEQLKIEAKKHIDSTVKILENNFAKSEYKSAQNTVKALKYWYRIKNNIDEKLYN